MKNTRAVYKKLREIKYFHLIKLYKIFSKRVPENCKYNILHYIVSNDRSYGIRLCMLHQPSLDIKDGVYANLLEVCQHPNNASNCNGFIYRFSKEEIQAFFEKELADTKIKEKKYSDICALEWVLEQSIIGIPPFNWIQKIYYIIKNRLTKNATL